MEYTFKNIVLVNFEPNRNFDRLDKEGSITGSYTWHKLTVADQNLNAFWLSVDDKAVNDLLESWETLKGKNVIVSGTFKLYRGMPKFKVLDVKLDK